MTIGGIVAQISLYALTIFPCFLDFLVPFFSNIIDLVFQSVLPFCPKDVESFTESTLLGQLWGVLLVSAQKELGKEDQCLRLAIVDTTLTDRQTLCDHFLPGPFPLPRLPTPSSQAKLLIPNSRLGEFHCHGSCSRLFRSA